ncbi:MAG: 50S ribosomal protein L24 [Aeriscardovia sp.]|nr:50S ribosomal protein L24 [Aeriscardovia sp.]
MVAKLRSGDLVKVIYGKDRGKQGKILKVLPNGRIVVEGVQIVKRHKRAQEEGQEAGIVSMEASIDRSNVMLVDPETGKPTRVGVSIKREVRGGKVKITRTRISKKSGKEIKV